jgi:TPP-dependent pyruvate/acetoin dehydrogenase alpha subunit
MGKKKIRKPKEKTDLKKYDLSKPLIEIIGSDEDPCFGDHLPTDSACKRCGDVELCSIVTAQKLRAERTKLSKTNTYRDEEDEDLMVKRDRRIKKLLEIWQDKGRTKAKMRELLMEKFTIREEEAKKYLKKYLPK